ncbi:MAG: Na+/H+ antiporter subunit E [Povalibacter sp.]
MKRLPVLLAVALFAMWLLLNNSFSLGQIILGAVLATFVARGSLDMRPLQPSIKRLHVALLLVLKVLLDILKSNIAVGRVVLGLTGGRPVTPGFMGVPLELRDPHGLAMLAVILTATPGTIWVEFDEETHHLMLHVLDLQDESRWINTIKQRYERPLMEIFE